MLQAHVPAVEPYSIDEMFLDLARLPVDLAQLAAEIDGQAPVATLPAQLFTTGDPVKSAKFMGALDALNARYGRGALRPAATAPEAPWGRRRGRLSPRYTTNLAEIMDAHG